MALEPLDAREPEEASDSSGGASAPPRSYWSYRKPIAIGALVAFALNFFLAQDITSSAQDSEASAIQIIQVWVPHIYYAILITGVTVALYVWSRAAD